MTQTFVPFLQAAKAGALSHHQDRISFPQHSSENPAQTTEAPDPSPHLPRCELKKEGDRIVEIRIYCNCGEVTELKCEY